ncbi:MAG: hypothetical protein L0I76_07410 [Pseudonocardia sp.]|nr:hypothetical protein [Pseudonocardia sp.]
MTGSDLDNTAPATPVGAGSGPVGAAAEAPGQAAGTGQGSSAHPGGPTGGDSRFSGSALASLDSGLLGPAGDSAPAAPGMGAEGPHPGSIYAPADGSAPPDSHQVKAHSGSRRYHTTESPYYIRTRADVYFVGVAEAEAAGFIAWNERPGKR